MCQSSGVSLFLTLLSLCMHDLSMPRVVGASAMTADSYPGAARSATCILLGFITLHSLMSGGPWARMLTRPPPPGTHPPLQHVRRSLDGEGVKEGVARPPYLIIHLDQPLAGPGGANHGLRQLHVHVDAGSCSAVIQ
jgi:hypothetical protein